MMRRFCTDLIVAGILLTLASMDGPELWRAVAGGCRVTARQIGRVGIYAEHRADVLTNETA